MSPFMHVCPQPGCAELSPAAGLCPRHRAARDRARNTLPHRSVYRDPRWRRTRRAVLARDGYRCTIVEGGERCLRGHPRGKGLHAHHHPLTVRELLELGLDPFDPARVVTVCHSHHSRLVGE